MRDTLRYQEIGSSRKYQQPEPKSTTFIIEIKGKQCHVNNASIIRKPINKKKNNPLLNKIGAL